MFGALVGQIYLVIYIVQSITSGRSLWLVALCIALMVVFGASYVLLPAWMITRGQIASGRSATPAKVAVLGWMLVLTIPMIVLADHGYSGLWIYVGVAAAMMLTMRLALSVSLVLAAAMVAVSAWSGEQIPWELAVTLVALTLWMGGFAGNLRLNIELQHTRAELARAAVAAERERIGRDLHDILGHSLTAIAVKAGLARRLADRDPAGSAAEIGDIERLAREALSDVRATAAGYRDVSLAGELAVARSVLQAAGIAVEMPSAVDDVTPAGREVFGYVVREAVTNVVRHSRATRCVISLHPDSIEISDNGRPLRGGPGGSGLAGLAERMRSVGGTLTAGPRPLGGFRVLAGVGPTIPDAGPAGGAVTNTVTGTPVAAPAGALGHPSGRDPGR
jgi:two-component system sensor histidine kinase DesK